MVPEKYQLASVGQFLIAAFERRRPGLIAWTPELERELLAESEAELLQMETQCRELGIDDEAYWKKARGALSTILIPRYAALVKDELALQRAGYHLWRNGDIVARIAFAGAGLMLGAAAVAIPWIPVTEKWVPWLLFVGGPLIPDAQLWFYRKRYERRLNHLIADLGRAGRSLDTYRSISEMQRALGEPGPISLPGDPIEAPPSGLIEAPARASIEALPGDLIEAPPIADRRAQEHAEERAPDEPQNIPERLKH